MSGDIVEEVKAVLQKAVGKLEKLQLRSLAEFLESGRLDMPSNTAELEERLPTNLLYYQANYLLILLLLLAITALIRPLFFAVFLFVLAAGIFVLGSDLDSLSKTSQGITKDQIMLVYIAVSGVLLLWFGGATLLVALSIGVLIIIVHAVLRKRSIKSRVFSWFDVLNGYTPLGVVSSDIAKKVENDFVDDAPPVRRTHHTSSADRSPVYSAQYREIQAKYRKK